MLRYVVLYHETPPDYPRPAHYDLMLESSGVLRTWALAEPPSANCDLAAEQLADHRLAYLDYEGEVSGGRGTVTRWDAGTYDTRNEKDLRWEVQVNGERMRGQLILSRDSLEAKVWRMQFVPH